MLKYDIPPNFECQNRIFNVKIRYLARFQKGFCMIKYNIRPNFECQNSGFKCQNRIFNVKIPYSAPFRMSKKDFECQNTIISPSSNVKIGF